ncbi:MAG: chemotaxis-specific protein-glutamate methyltransferase CheB [Pseudomonadota bacterium]
MPVNGPVRVLIVDDSRTIRAMIRSVLDADSRFVVVGEAGDPYAARDLIKEKNPDVLTLDVEMPRMNGLVFLRNLMRLRPMPVVMVSTRTSEQSEDAVTALSLGAVDCIDLKRVHGAPDIQSKLTETLLIAAGASLQKTDVASPAAASPTNDFQWSGKIVLIGSSTGGVEALERVFSAFPANCPPTLVAQHMPASFLASFAERLNSNVAPKVQLARSAQVPEPGNIYLAPGGDQHLSLKAGDVPRIRLVADADDQLYIPAVDVLFRSAEPMATSIVSVILTGMGRDGADAMLGLRTAGADTLAQDAHSAVIDGMPGAARANGSAAAVYPIAQIGAEILKRSGTFERQSQ